MKNNFWDTKEIKSDTVNLTPQQVAAIKYNLDLFVTLTFGNKSNQQVKISNLIKE